MISAAAGALVVSGVCIKQPHCCPFNCFGTAYHSPCTISRKNFSSRSAVSSYVRSELFNAPYLAGEGSLADLEVARVQPQEHLVTLRNEAAVAVWRGSYYSAGEGEVASSQRWDMGRPRLLLEFADAKLSAVESSEILDTDLSTKGEDSASGGFKFHLMEGLKDLIQRQETVKEEVTSLDSPTPSDVGSPDPISFAVVSAGLFLLFWLANYLVPDLVFKNIIQKKVSDESEEDNAPSLAGKSTCQPIDGSTREDRDHVLSSKKLATGFGKNTQKRVKGGRKK